MDDNEKLNTRPSSENDMDEEVRGSTEENNEESLADGAQDLPSSSEKGEPLESEENKQVDTIRDEESPLPEEIVTETSASDESATSSEEIAEPSPSTNESESSSTEETSPSGETTENAFSGWTAISPDISDAQRADDGHGSDRIEGEYTGKQNLEEMKSYFRPINYVRTSASNIDDEVENVRKTFSSKWSMNRVFNIVSVVIMLLCFIAVILVVFLIDDESLTWVTWTVIGIALALIIICFIIGGVLNKRLNKQAEQYLDVYEDTINGYTLSDLDLENTLICTQGQLDDQLIIQAHCFNVISSITSRGVVLAKRNGHEFASGEAAVIVPTISIQDANKLPTSFIDMNGDPYIPELEENNPADTSTQELPAADITMVDVSLADENEQNKKGKKHKKKEKQMTKESTNTNTGLYGRFYNYDCKVSSKESFIISIMGTASHTYIPDYLAGFEAVKIPGLKNNILVFVSDITHSAKFFDEEGIRLLNAIPTNSVVYSHFISVNSYGMKCGMNLSDDIMELPLDRLEHLGSYDLLKDATDAVFALFDHIESVKE